MTPAARNDLPEPRGASSGVVLAMAPPYESNPWLGVGLPLIRALLAEAGIPSVIPRFLAHAGDTPTPLALFSRRVTYDDFPLDERRHELADIARAHAPFFDDLTAVLMARPERVFGFSIWRHNVDVSLELARRLKEARPDILIVLGGPEAVEGGEQVRLDWVDAVVTSGAETLVGSLFRAALDGELGRASSPTNVWVHPRHQRHPLERALDQTAARIPRIDYADLMSLFQADGHAPFLLNLGCPFRCRFCTNTSIYPNMLFGDVERVSAEMNQVVELWSELPDAPHLVLTLCDATVNANPAQFDALLERMAAFRWPTPPILDGMIVVDQRITRTRVAAFARARFQRPFFGLETASPRIRKAMKKPGSVEDVRAGLVAFAEARGDVRVNLNVIVGWPDETPREHEETLAFLDAAIELGVIGEIGVMPLARSPLAMDHTLLGDAGGATRGYAWIGQGAAGDPAVRCRRVLDVFERFGSAVRVSSPIPRDQLIDAMMPEAPAGFRDAWCDQHGRVSFYTGASASEDEPTAAERGEPTVAARRDESRSSVVAAHRRTPDRAPNIVEQVADTNPSVADEPRAGQSFLVAAEALVRRAFSAAGGDDARLVLDAIERRAPDRLEVVFMGLGAPVVLYLEPRTHDARAFATTEAYAISYATVFRDASCEKDPAVIERLVARLRTAERE